MSISEASVCKHHNASFSRAWCIGERVDVLERIINDYKFQRVHAAHGVLASLLASVTPVFPIDCVVIPVPTVASHVRRRGYDHTLLLAKRFAYLKGLKIERALARRGRAVQTGSTRKERHIQARSAFALRKPVKDKVVVLIDDVVTTGATVTAAAEVLRGAGARDIWVVAAAYQPLD